MLSVGVKGETTITLTLDIHQEKVQGRPKYGQRALLSMASDVREPFGLNCRNLECHRHLVL